MVNSIECVYRLHHLYRHSPNVGGEMPRGIIGHNPWRCHGVSVGGNQPQCVVVTLARLVQVLYCRTTRQNQVLPTKVCVLRYQSGWLVRPCNIIKDALL
jgi:hypothetical protein